MDKHFAVRFVQVDAIRQQLDIGNVVLLTNLAYSAAGEVLSCNIYDVATHAAIEMEADKLICMTLKVCPISHTSSSCLVKARMQTFCIALRSCYRERSRQL